MTIFSVDSLKYGFALILTKLVPKKPEIKLKIFFSHITFPHLLNAYTVTPLFFHIPLNPYFIVFLLLRKSFN